MRCRAQSDKIRRETAEEVTKEEANSIVQWHYGQDGSMLPRKVVFLSAFFSVCKGSCSKQMAERLAFGT